MFHLPGRPPISIRTLLFGLLLLVSLVPLAVSAAFGLHGAILELRGVEEQYEALLLEERLDPLRQHIRRFETLSLFVSQLPAVPEILGEGTTRPGSIGMRQAKARYAGVLRRAFDDYPDIVAVHVYDLRGEERLFVKREADSGLETVAAPEVPADLEDDLGFDQALGMAEGRTALFPKVVSSPDGGRRLLLRMVAPVRYAGRTIGVYANDIDVGLLSKAYPDVHWVWSDGRRLGGDVETPEVLEAFPGLGSLFATGEPGLTRKTKGGDQAFIWQPVLRDAEGGPTLWAGSALRRDSAQAAQQRGARTVLASLAVVVLATVVAITLITSRVRAFLVRVLSRVEAVLSGEETGQRPANTAPTGLAEVDGFMARLDALIADYRHMEAERRRAEALREDFNRLLHHDIRSPISGLLQLPGLVRADGPLTPFQREMLELMEDTGYKVLAMLRASFELPRLEEGDYPLDCQVFDMLALVRRTLRLVEAIGSHKGAGSRVTLDGAAAPEPDDETTLPFWGDELLVFSMLTNLLKNAFEASEPGAVVAVELVREDGRLLVTVRNRGAAPVEVRERFFDKYSTSGKKRGMGLGTYSARLVARAHGGDITMRTSEEEGTTVTVVLPHQTRPNTTLTEPEQWAAE